ncbi:hypothetical protein MSPP1_000420 [Malassezia sp. CBS 17886]|nr:hypothetical protein MSPP1_000420 [Malassezia sp. CBS 17886]
MESDDGTRFRAPEGAYQCVDWANPLQVRAAPSSAAATLPTAPRTARRGEAPRLSATTVWSQRHARTDAHGGEASASVVDHLAAQGVDLHGADIDAGATLPDVLLPGVPTSNCRVAKPTRPKTGLRSSHSSFITRVQTIGDIGKAVSQKGEGATVSLLSIEKTLLWFASVDGRIRDPLLRITFATAPTCHDFNQYTRAADRMDVIVGFAGGDLVWIDPITLRYTRLNKRGCISTSSVRQVRWIPGQESLFLAAHDDGCILVMDRDREDSTDFAASCRRTDGWDSRTSVLVSRPVSGGSARATSRETPWARLNPVSHWRVSRRALTDFAFSPDRLQVAVVAEDGLLRIVDMDAECLVRAQQSYFGGFMCVCWSPDGSLILTGGQDDLLSFWSAEVGGIVARAQGHKSFVTDMAFDPWYKAGSDVYRILSVGEDAQVCVWDFCSAALQRPRAHAQRADHASLAGSVMLSDEVPVYSSALSRTLVSTLQPAAVWSVPGPYLVGVRVRATSVVLLHCDGQVDLFRRPVRPIFDTRDADSGDASETKNVSRMTRAFGSSFGFTGLRKRQSQYMGGLATA